MASAIAITVLITSGDIAAVGTILTLIFSAHMNFIAAAGAMCRIWRLGFWMLVPPFDSTAIGAESSATSFVFINWLAALCTEVDLFCDVGGFLPTAV